MITSYHSIALRARTHTHWECAGMHIHVQARVYYLPIVYKVNKSEVTGEYLSCLHLHEVPAKKGRETAINSRTGAVLYGGRTEYLWKRRRYP